MQLVVGMGSIKEYEPLVRAGADEIFCGFVPHEWNEAYGTALPLNRREVLAVNVQISNYEDMEILADMQAELKVPVTITFNSLTYHPKQYSQILTMMEKLCSMGFCDFIVADLCLMLKIKQAQLPVKLHISGEYGEYNQWGIELLETFSPKRYIFHRKNTWQEMKLLIDETNAKRKAQGREKAEFEAFFLNENCHYTGAYCNSLHCDELNHICHLPYTLSAVSGRLDKTKISEKMEQGNDEAIGNSGCGVCGLSELRRSGITHLKIVGRGKYIEEMEQDVKFAARVLKEEESHKSEDWRKYVRDTVFTKGCSRNCYYMPKC